MCGITGFFKAGGLKHSERTHLENMAATLHHRGPDGYGYHFDEKQSLAMGHARLSIIDLETGDQPLYSQDRKKILTVNGEFYDYKRIRTDLRLEGFQFSTKADSEIALPLYEKHGLDFVEHLRGEFGFVLYDDQNNRLIMVRDRFGIKPLFYHIADGVVYWGSEIKALFAHPGIPKAFCEKALLHQLMHTMVPGTSAFNNIFAIKPGHMLVVQRNSGQLTVNEYQYWDLDFPHEDERDYTKSSDFYIKLVQEELQQAVLHRLEADVPVGCYLSGGIDSCSMLGLASSLQQSPVKAFTISFDNVEYDESHIAKEMAKKVHADHVQINLSAKELYGDNFIKTLWHAERTFYNTLGVAKWCMSKEVNQNDYRVVVTGEGSDELFGGYPFFKRDMLKYGHLESGHSREEVENYKKLMEQSNKLFRGAILSEKEIRHPVMDDVCGFTPSWIQPWMQTLEIARPLLHDDILDQLRGYDPIAAIADSFDRKQLDGRHVLDKVQYTWNKTMLECQILNWGGDRVDMANSMESRPAFLDHHVAKLAVEIPPHLRINGNTEKWVLREAMKHVLPRVLYEREKFAFMSPPAHTDLQKKEALNQLLDRFASKEAFETTQLFDSKRVLKFIKEYQQDKDPVSLIRKDALINHIIGLQILHHHFIGSV